MLDRSRLINQETGKINLAYINERAYIRAVNELGPSISPKDLRNAASYYRDLAQIERKQWRLARGLPDDTVYITVAAYGRDVQGLRRSAF
jgi:hypothetical protein